MIIDVDVSSGSLALEHPAVFNAFHVSATGGDVGAVVAALGAHGRACDDAHVYIAIDSLRAWAKGHVDDDWDAGFGKMLEYARSKGWLDDAGTHVRAHIEWAL